MTLITAAQRQKLLENGRAQRDAIDRQDQILDFEPVVRNSLPPTAMPPGFSPSSTPTPISPSVSATSASANLREPARAHRRSKPSRATARVRSRLRADTHNLSLRRLRPRASTDHHLIP